MDLTMLPQGQPHELGNPNEYATDSLNKDSVTYPEKEGLIDGRTILHRLLKQIADNVYFVQGTGMKISYPCFVYEITRPDIKRANNGVYGLDMGYKVTYMSRKPESIIPLMLRLFTYCSVDTIFTSEGVFHENFTVYIRPTL